jgi:hypothetical protein
MGSNRPADLGSDSDSDEPPLFMGESDSTRESTEECVNRGSVHKKKACRRQSEPRSRRECDVQKGRRKKIDYHPYIVHT